MLRYSSLPTLLQYDDRNSMSYSVESRVPYLDHRVVEFALSLPPGFIIKNGFSKQLLRESMKDILPEKIYKRRSKLGYATPQQNWLDKPEIKKRIQAAAGRNPLVDETKVSKALADISNPKVGSLLWRVLLFDIWMERFNVSI